MNKISVQVNATVPLHRPWPDPTLVEVVDPNDNLVGKIFLTPVAPAMWPWLETKSALLTVEAADLMMGTESYSLGVFFDSKMIPVTLDRLIRYFTDPECSAKWIVHANGKQSRVLTTGKLQVQVRVRLYVEADTLPMIRGELTISYGEQQQIQQGGGS